MQEFYCFANTNETLYFDDVVFDGKFDHIDGTFEVQLLHNVVFMRFDGTNTDKKPVGDFLIGIAFAPQFQYLNLPGTQTADTGGLVDCIRLHT